MEYEKMLREINENKTDDMSVNYHGMYENQYGYFCITDMDHKFDSNIPTENIMQGGDYIIISLQSSFADEEDCACAAYFCGINPAYFGL